MFLNIWDDLRDFFTHFFTNISVGNIISFILGIIFCLIIIFIIYIVALVKSLEVSKKENEFNKSELSENDNLKNIEIINNYINNSKSRYDDFSKGYTVSEKVNITKEIIETLIYDIAKVYYPESNHPVAELNITELIALDRYIVLRIEQLFDKKFISIFKKTKVSTLLNMLDKKKSIEESKIVKGAKKFHVGETTNFLSNILNVLNPANIFNKIAIKTAVGIGTNKIMKIIIDIVGSETAKVYSKNVFAIDEEKIDNEIKIASEEVEEVYAK